LIILHRSLNLAAKLRDFGVRTMWYAKSCRLRIPHCCIKGARISPMTFARVTRRDLRYSYELGRRIVAGSRNADALPVMHVYAITTRRGRRRSVGLYAPRECTTRNERLRARRGERNSRKEEGCSGEGRRWVREREGESSRGKRSTRYGATPIASPVVQSAFRTGVASFRSSFGIFLRVRPRAHRRVPPNFSRDQWACDISAVTSGPRPSKSWPQSHRDGGE